MGKNDINDSIVELNEKISWLEKLYDQTVQYVNQSIELFWGILAGVFALLGAALYFLARQIVAEKVNSELEKIRIELQGYRDEYLEKKYQLDMLIKKVEQLQSNTPEFFQGTGSPEGNVTARKGAMYLQIDEGSEPKLYVKVRGSGNAGWAPIQLL